MILLHSTGVQFYAVGYVSNRPLASNEPLFTKYCNENVTTSILYMEGCLSSSVQILG